jgi:hypothetical protein
MHVVMAQEVSSVPQAVNTPLRVTDYMMSGNYRYPDKKPFELNHWWKGLSVSTYWYPKLLNFQKDYDGFELGSAGIALTKDLNKSNAFRLGFAYTHERLEGMLDYQWNLTNYWKGYDPSRKFEWLATVGILGGLINYEGNYRKFYGGQVGLQLRHTLSPVLSLYIEPQYKAASSLYDNHWEYGNLVDDGLAVQVGLIARLSSPWKEGGYGPAITRGSSAFGNGMAKTGEWITSAVGRMFMGHGMKVNRNYSLHRWYVELLGGTQLRLGRESLSKLRPYQYDMEMTLGVKLNNFFSFQVGAYEERLDLTQKSEYPENAYGYRAELTVNPLRFLWHKSEDKGWAWTVGGGLEVGRVDTWDHTGKSEIYRYIKPTVHTQLRRKLFGQTWLVLQGRFQTMNVDNDNRQVTAYAGLHHNLSARKSSHLKHSNWWKGLWIAGSYGLWSTRDNLLNFALGYDFNDIHTLRVDYSYSHIHSHNPYVVRTYLNLLAMDYMVNIRNLYVGYDPNRRLNVYMFAGYNLASHKDNGGESIWHSHSYIGIEGGAQLELMLNKHWSVFVEEKSVCIPGDRFVTPDYTQSINFMGTAGMKVKF